MECMTKDNLNAVCCKGKYSKLKLSIEFIAAYFTAKSRTLKPNKLKQFSAVLKHTTCTFQTLWSHFQSCCMFPVVFWGSDRHIRSDVVQQHLPLHVCSYIVGIREFGSASGPLPQCWQTEQCPSRPVCCPCRRQTSSMIHPGRGRLRWELICIIQGVPIRSLLF